MTGALKRLLQVFVLLLLVACGNAGPCQVHVKFDEVKGLSESASVRVNGKNVGHVRQITPVQDHHLVCIELDKGVDIPSGSSFELGREEFFGAPCINIILNPDEGKYVQDRDTVIGVSQAGLPD